MSPDDPASMDEQPLDVNRLLAATLPLGEMSVWTTRLAAAWGTLLQLDACCLLWRDERSGLLHGRIWLSDEPTRELDIDASEGSLPGLTTRLGASDPRLVDLVWETLPGFPEEDVLIGVSPSSARPRIHTAWKSATSNLWRAASQYEDRFMQEKLESLAQFAAGAGHEINNPLGSIIGRASQLLAGDLSPDQRRLVETIGAQAYRIRDMIGDTMLFARPPQPKFEFIDFWDIVRQVISRHQETLDRRSISLITDLKGSAPLYADRDQIAIVISELFRNSITGLPPGGQLQLRGTSASAPSPSHCLDVIDNGLGLTAENRRHCFDPFYSGSAAGRGLGFGLAKAWQIVRQHRGILSVLPAAHETCFRVTLPSPATRD